jgi:hypothetical protein
MLLSLGAPRGISGLSPGFPRPLAFSTTSEPVAINGFVAFINGSAESSFVIFITIYIRIYIIVMRLIKAFRSFFTTWKNSGMKENYKSCSVQVGHIAPLGGGDYERYQARQHRIGSYLPGTPTTEGLMSILSPRPYQLPLPQMPNPSL